MIRFVPGNHFLETSFVPGNHFLETSFVPGNHFLETTITRNFMKNPILRVKMKFLVLVVTKKWLPGTKLVSKKWLPGT